MIIQGHPDILLGPQGLNGLHGFGSLPPQGASPAYIRFMPEKGGAGIEALYKEIRDFLATNPTDAELKQAMAASGVSEGDIADAFTFDGMEVFPIVDDYTFEKFCPPGSILVGGSCVGIGGAEQYEKTMVAANAAKTASAEFVARETAQGRTPTKTEIDRFESYFYQELMAAAFPIVEDVEQPPTGLAPIPDSSLRNREIVDYVTTHSDAEILAAMATTGVTQSDIIRAFASFDPTMPNGQSPAYARSLPENGGQGIEAFYREINDYVNSHSFYEVLSQMFRSEVSRADLEAATSYAFEKQQSRTPTEYAADQAAQAAAQAAQAAAAVPTKVFTATSQSPAYTRFLPESGGKGITALYKEISDFVGTHSNAEIQTAMTASGVSEVDVINALQVFPNRPIVKATETVTATKDTGLALPLVVSAIAAFFVLG